MPIDPIFLNPPYGIFSRIARALGKSPSHVRKVALGFHTSRRVAAALIAEKNRLKKEWERAA